MEKSFCPHCWPTKRTSHLQIHVNYYLNTLFSLFERVVKATTEPFRKRVKSAPTDYLWGVFLKSLVFLRIASFSNNPDRSQLYNRSLIFFEEALRRGLDIQSLSVLGRQKNEFKFRFQGKNYHYDDIPLIMFGEQAHEMDDKADTKKRLHRHGFPVAEGKCFTSKTRALSYARTIEFPLVVKPHDGSLSEHVTCHIGAKEKLVDAIDIARQYSPAFILEKFITGSMFRATVVGKTHEFICQKDIANVVGDGESTIEELIEMKNAHPYRGDTDQKNTTLHKIPINERLINNLQQQRYSLKSVLAQGQKLYLQEKFVLSHGCDIINVTDSTHPDNKKLFLEVAKALDAELVGIDFICPDITRSYKEQTTAVLETNSLPYIDMHQFPSHGNSENVAEVVWDVVLNKLETTGK